MKRPHNVERLLGRWIAYGKDGYSVRCIKRGKCWSAFYGGGVYSASTLTKLAELIAKH